MSTYIHMCTCVYVFMYSHVYACMYLRMHADVHECIYVSNYYNSAISAKYTCL
jgi:hypothetical protein